METEALIEIGSALGTGGMLWAFIYQMRKEHKDERNQLNDRNQKNHETTVDLAAKSTEAITKLTTIIEASARK